jgi:MFS family permease
VRALTRPSDRGQIGVCILVLGFSNFIWVPFARAFGRRPMLLVSTLLGIGAAIWRARARSYDSFLGASIVSGIACGPGETFGPMVRALGCLSTPVKKFRLVPPRENGESRRRFPAADAHISW